MLKLLRRTAIGLGVAGIAMALVIAVLIIGRSTPGLGFEGSEVWAHAGLRVDEKPDTLEAFLAAFNAGATGIEFNIQYLEEADRFIIAHDMPEVLDLREVLFLDPVLAEIAGKGRIWLDFKNLSMANRKAAKLRLGGMLEKYGIKDQVFVESRNGPALREFAAEGYRTIYWISYNPDRGLFWLPQLNYLFNIYLSEYAAISLPAEVITDGFFMLHPDIPVFTFTVNEPEKIDTLLSHPRIRVVLTDLNYFPPAAYGEPAMLSPR